MKVETTVCDFNNTIACRRLADGQCSLCQRDACRDHLSASIGIQILVSNAKYLDHSVPICANCQQFVVSARSKTPSIDKKVLVDLLDEWLKNLRVMWAAEALVPGSTAPAPVPPPLPPLWPPAPPEPREPPPSPWTKIKLPKPMLK